MAGHLGRQASRALVLRVRPAPAPVGPQPGWREAVVEGTDARGAREPPGQASFPWEGLNKQTQTHADQSLSASVSSRSRKPWRSGPQTHLLPSWACSPRGEPHVSPRSHSACPSILRAGKPRTGPVTCSLAPDPVHRCSRGGIWTPWPALLVSTTRPDEGRHSLPSPFPAVGLAQGLGWGSEAWGSLGFREAKTHARKGAIL